MKNPGQIQIIELTYQRIMRLKFMFQFVCSLQSADPMQRAYPNVLNFAYISFATDFYITVKAMLDSGRMSFLALDKSNKNIKQVVDDCKKDIAKYINLKRRNNIFAHMNRPIEQRDIQDVLFNGPSVLDALIRLHAECRRILNLRDDQWNHYTFVDFDTMSKEFMWIEHTLRNARFDEMIDKINKE